ncbi:MAG: (2Fe-2S)-binding protein [Chloroflexi bacterium]|nr:(2Fe-2S)-binding protein [Chloroflexota bacterium]
MKKTVSMTVNGFPYELEVEPRRTLLEVLREQIGLTGTKRGCDRGDCGACTVIIDGNPVASCLTLAIEVHGKNVTTIEGLARDGHLHPIQRAFVDHGAIQCGFCTPGMIMSATALLTRNPNPTDEEIREGLSGNLCRCGGYNRIMEAITAVRDPGMTKSE